MARLVFPAASSLMTCSSREVRRVPPEAGGFARSWSIRAISARRVQPEKHVTRRFELELPRFFVAERTACEGHEHADTCGLERHLELLPLHPRTSQFRERRPRLLSRQEQCARRVRGNGPDNWRREVSSQRDQFLHGAVSGLEITLRRSIFLSPPPGR